MPITKIEPLPPKEAIDAFERKGYRIGFAWQDVWQQEHARAFTVAKATSVDILRDIREAVDAALTNGTTLAQFRKDLEPILQAKGWWGKSYRIDPLAGDRKVVQLGSPRRLRTIYDTNLRMSHAAGRWERIEQTAATRPYLRYVAILDSRVRPQHRAWNNTTLPVGHEFWSTHAPPNGWHCRCTVQQLSDRDVNRMGLPLGDVPPTPMRAWKNPRTGETTEVPQGIDPGFGYNPGQAASVVRQSREVLTGKLDGSPEDIARAAIADSLDSESLTTFLRPRVGEKTTATLPDSHPVALAGENLRGAMRGKVATVTLPIETVRRQAEAGDLPPQMNWLRLQDVLDNGAMTGKGRLRTVKWSPYQVELERTSGGRIEVRSFTKEKP